MHNDSDAILDDLLARWHHHCKSYSPIPVRGADPMFRNAKSGKGWDTTSEVIEDEINGKMMKAIDFQVGEMAEPHRTAIYILARNCYTGRNVWLSNRLPQEPAVLAIVVREARNMLTRRLMAAGVM